MSKTVTQIVNAALQSLGLIEDDDTVGSSGSTDAQNMGTVALGYLNDLLALCSAESMMIPAITRKTVTLGAQDYQFTMTERPLNIEGLAYLYAANDERWLDPMDVDEFEGIVDKTVVSQPRRYYYNGSYPYGTMYFDCTVASGSQFVLLYLAAFTQASLITDSVSIPDEYYPYLQAETAILMAGAKGMAIPVGVSRLASRARQTVRRRAGLLRIRELTVDYGVPAVSRGKINIETEA